jgi:hypothetical protein
MPQIYTVEQIARPAYYDRQPIAVFTGYANIVGPHATTLRASYSPPGGYANFGEIVMLGAIRATAAPGNALASAIMNIAPFYGGEFSVGQANLDNLGVGAEKTVILTQVGYIAFGDTLKFYTVDGSAGGTIQYNLYFKGTEFLY